MFTLKDIAKMSQLTTRTLQNHLKEGLLKGTKIGRSWRFTEENLKDYLDQGATEIGLRDVLDEQVSSFMNQELAGVLTVLKIKQGRNSRLISCVADYISHNIPDGLITYKAFFKPALELVEITIIATLERTLQITRFVQTLVEGASDEAAVK
ncbi:MAG: helix-turn-helix domain-containing protein [Spirochaetes bacterium]|nr:helix-turn-helix domain-containing protein [Spirochaetota bacterium]